MKLDVITFGSATLDILVQPREEHIVQLCTDDDCEDMVAYPSGSKILIERPVVEIGGGATNTAVCLARLGLSVGMGGSVGVDHHGNDVIESLKEENVRFVGHRTETPTNMSVILDIHKLHDRTIMAYKGSSDELLTSKLDFSTLDATWYYFSSLLGTAYKTMLDLMRHARKHEIAIAFNPSSYQTQQGLDNLREPIELSNLLVMNREEAEMLVGHAPDAKEVCRRLRREGAEIILITEGEKGATLLYGATIYVAPSVHDKPVLDTTGAGDCCASTFLGGLALGLSPKKALILALLNAENLITEIGAKHGLLSREEALRRLEADSRHVSEENL